MTEPRWIELVPAYVLDALDVEERDAFEARLTEDPALREAVREERELMAELAGGVTPRTPPPGLRERIMAEARETPRGDADAEPATERRSPAAVAAEAPGRPSRLPWLAAAAAFVVAMGFGLFAQSLAERRGALEGELTATRQALDEARGQLAERDSLLSTFLGPDVRSVALSATDQPPSARLFWNTRTATILVAAFNLPPAPEGRIYQLWGIASGENPVSLGTFQTGTDGTALLQRPAPAGSDFDLGAVTEEPAGGSPQPTSAPFLVGNWTDG